MTGQNEQEKSASVSGSRQQLIVMRGPADDRKTPTYIAVSSYTLDRCLRSAQQYFDKHGPACGLGPLVADLKLMAMGLRCSIDEDA